MSKIDEIHEGMTKVAMKLVNNLRKEDWESYTNDDIYEIFELLHGSGHPLVAEYKKLDNDLTDEITNTIHKAERGNKYDET